MRYASYVACGVACASVVSLAIYTARPRRDSITKDPAAYASEVDPKPGLAPAPVMRTPMAASTGNGAKHRPKLDTPIEPWTGEDLAPKVAASQAAMLKVDTSDPWDPNVRSHFEPRHEMQPYEDVYGRRDPGPLAAK
jgi:hypothetical protein